jgi:hypothetical protein
MGNRVRVATAECAGCHFIFPKPEMRQVEWREGAGYESGRRTDRFNTMNQRTGYSVSQGRWRRGRRVAVWYCIDCFDLHRRSVRHRRFWTAALCLGALTAFWFMLPNSPTSQQGNLKLFEAEDRASPTQRLVGDQAGKLMVPPSTDEQVLAVEGQQSERMPGDLDNKDPIQPDPSNTPQIMQAINAAFQSGETTRWQSEGASGYAVPSEKEPDSGCRTIFYTIDTVSPTYQSPEQTIC